MSLYNNTVNDTFITFHSCNPAQVALAHSVRSGTRGHVAYVTKNKQTQEHFAAQGTNSSCHLTPRRQKNATAAMEPGKESKTLSSASHLHNNAPTSLSLITLSPSPSQHVPKVTKASSGCSKRLVFLPRIRHLVDALIRIMVEEHECHRI